MSDLLVEDSFETSVGHETGNNQCLHFIGVLLEHCLTASSGRPKQSSRMLFRVVDIMWWAKIPQDA